MSINQPGFRSCDRKRHEAQPFRSEDDGFAPRSRHRSAVHRGQVKPQRNDVPERKMTLKFHSRTPSLLQDCTSLPATVESGINGGDMPFIPWVFLIGQAAIVVASLLGYGIFTSRPDLLVQV